MSLLDLICDNTQAAPVIISTNNNLQSINWVRGMSDPGEMIACGAYQQLRRNAGESDETYAARLTVLLQSVPADVRAKIEASGRTAAIQRAGLDTTGGRVRVMTAGKAPWHGLGVNVESAVNSADAIKLAGLDWKVLKTALTYTAPDGTTRSQNDVFGLVREDTGDMLGSIGSRYQVIQNSDGFDFLDVVLKQFGARYESAGSIFGGSKVWMLARFPQQSFTVNGSDAIDTFAAFTNPHDGSGKAYCYPTTERIVCGNTYTVSAKDNVKGIGIRHTGNLKAKIAEAQRALGLAVEGFEHFKENAQLLCSKRMPDAKAYFNAVLDETCEVTADQSRMGALALAHILTKDTGETPLLDSLVKSLEKKIERRANILEDICERHESEKCGVNGMRGTAFSSWSAVTEHADHARIGKQSRDEVTRLSRRFESTLAGDADTMKEVAYQLALKA